MSCSKYPVTKKSFEVAVNETQLSALHKIILMERYVKVLSVFEARCLRLSIFFHVMRILVTVGSLVVPALLSIQYVDFGEKQNSNITDAGTFAYRIYWATWIISLLVTTSNGILSVFKVDKKYYFLHTTLEQLRSEGWQFLELSGRYSGFYTPHVTPSHANQFIYFCNIVEKIKMRQVEEEYYKLSDSNSHQTAQQPKTNGETKTEAAHDKKIEITSLIPPTPLNSLLEQAQNMPPELLRQIVSMASGNIQSPPSPERKSETDLEGVSSHGATAPSVSVQKELQTDTASEKSTL